MDEKVLEKILPIFGILEMEKFLQNQILRPINLERENM
jgi:hypothetical protein